MQLPCMPHQGARLDKFNKFNNLGFGMGVAFILSKAFSFVSMIQTFHVEGGERSEKRAYVAVDMYLGGFAAKLWSFLCL